MSDLAKDLAEELPALVYDGCALDITSASRAR